MHTDLLTLALELVESPSSWESLTCFISLQPVFAGLVFTLLPSFYSSVSDNIPSCCLFP